MKVRESGATAVTNTIVVWQQDLQPVGATTVLVVVLVTMTTPARGGI
jgi:hypothetical protein